jgi:hypothetical protein
MSSMSTEELQALIRENRERNLFPRRRKTPSERLLTRLRALGLDIPEGATIARTYAGVWQRRDGAWSWYAQQPDGRPIDIGSQYAVGDLLRERYLCATVGWREPAIHIDPTVPGEPLRQYREAWAETPDGPVHHGTR